MSSGHTWGPKDSDYRTPLARARGKGAAGGHSEEWLKERFAFVAWVPLAIYIAVSLFLGVAASYHTMQVWLSNPITISLVFAAVLASVVHGFEVITVIQDYVHNTVLKIILIWIVKNIFIAMVIFSAVCLLMIGL